MFHCGAGRDRTGQIAMLLLTLAGVEPEVVAADYALSAARLPALYAARGEEDEGPVLDAFLAERHTTAAELIVTTLTGLDVELCMRDAGLSDRELAALRRRLVGHGA